MKNRPTDYLTSEDRRRWLLDEESAPITPLAVVFYAVIFGMAFWVGLGYLVGTWLYE